jgi:5-methylcytosine-specific restriction endonuclease McrA
MFNSTIIPRKKQLKCGHFDYAFSKVRCKTCAQKQDAKPISKLSKKRESEVLGGGESLQNLVNDCDRLVSLVVRMSPANREGLCSCFVCGGINHYKNMDCSHYISRGNMATRFMLDNLTVSCKECNNRHNEDKTPYREAMDKINKGNVEYLESMAHTTYKWTIGELKEMRSELQQKVDLLTTKFIK